VSSIINILFIKGPIRMSNSAIIEKQYNAKAYVFHPLMEAFLIGGVIFVVVFTVSYFIYVHALNAQKGEIREGMVRVATTIATIIDGKLADLHKTFKSRSQNYFARLKPMVRSTVRAMVAGFFVSFMVGALVWFMRIFAAAPRRIPRPGIGVGRLALSSEGTPGPDAAAVQLPPHSVAIFTFGSEPVASETNRGGVGGCSR
jgi:hypothetical protein